MDLDRFPLLSIVIFLPLLGGLVTLFLGRNRKVIRAWLLVVTLAELALACTLLGAFNYGDSGMQFVNRFSWIETLGISYYVGLDGLSLWFLMLTAALGLVAALWSWRFLQARPDVDARSYAFLLLALETSVLGVFAALDMVLFYIFWEAMLVPAYLLIGRWGGARRVHATLKFFLYTMAGSALMLVAILALAVLNYGSTGVLTFDLLSMYQTPLGWSAQLWLFLAFALAFVVKAPVWPLHTWMPDAYVESPVPVTVLLAGVLSKMAIYGLLRYCLPLFPTAFEAARSWIWLLAITGILYGSLVALVQRDMKRLVAFSSLAHMGLIVSGVLAANAQGVQGALVQSVSHGLTISALFIVVDLLESRRGTRMVDDFGGLWKSIPVLGTLFLTIILASIGLPGLSGFPGEFLVLVGIFQESAVAAAIATLTIVLGAWYMLNLFRKTFAGSLNRAENRSLPDLGRLEALVLVPLVLLMFVIGVLPNLILRPTEPTVDRLLTEAEAKRVVLVDPSSTTTWLDDSR
jgi:NADH-quinone oxidoreductase subunit M